MSGRGRNYLPPWREDLLPPLKKFHQKSTKFLPGRLPAGLRSLQSSPAGLQISEISEIREKRRGAGNPFPQVKKPKKIFLVRCVDSKSLIP